MNRLYIPSEGKDYKVCGKRSICSYCDSIDYGKIGKCGMRKIQRRFRDIAANVKNFIRSILF